jgi:hypothetical protein
MCNISFPFKFVDSRPVLYFWLIIIAFEIILFCFNKNRISRFQDKPSEFGDRVFLKNNDAFFISFNRLIKSNLLFDKEYFKNSERTHLLLVQATGISMNACFVIIFLYWIISKFFYPNIHLSEMSSDTLIKAILFFISSILAIYWNLKTDQNKKFDYCLTTYNGIIKDKKPNDDITPLREACLALDILTMDLWPKRILASFFKRVLKNAINDDEKWASVQKGELFQNEAYEILLAYAKKLNS